MKAVSTERPVRVLAIAGSLRRASYNRLLLEAAAESAPPAVSVTLYDDLAAIPLFDEDLELVTDGGPPSVHTLRALVAAADGILFSTPEYNQSIPGVLKNAIDWLSRPGPAAAGAVEVLDGKPVAVVGASSGPWGTRLAQSAARQVLWATGAVVLGSPTLFVREAARLFDDRGRLVHEGTRERLAGLLDDFGRWIRMAGAAAGDQVVRAS